MYHENKRLSNVEVLEEVLHNTIKDIIDRSVKDKDYKFQIIYLLEFVDGHWPTTIDVVFAIEVYLRNYFKEITEEELRN